MLADGGRLEASGPELTTSRTLPGLGRRCSVFSLIPMTRARNLKRVDGSSPGRNLLFE